jgi:hypothetical protein
MGAYESSGRRRRPRIETRNEVKKICAPTTIVSASSRQGITTDTRHAGGASGATAMLSSGLGGYTAVRVCIVYDCLYPYTIGGAERRYRSLAERVVSRGHEFTFRTRR